MPRVGKQNTVNLSGHCKGCGLFFDFLRRHYSQVQSCKQLYRDDDKKDVYNDPESILSGPCKGCNKVFKSIRCHLREQHFCRSAYDMEELINAANERKRLKDKAFHQNNLEYCRLAHKERYMERKKMNRDSNLQRQEERKEPKN